jgi:hypothetical protein
MKRKFSVRVGLLCLYFLLRIEWCSAATFTWTGAVSSDWFIGGNWIPIGVPGSSDTVNFTNGSINLTAAVSIHGAFNWSGGTLGGNPLIIASGGVMNIAGSVTLDNVLTNAGTVTMTGPADFYLNNNNSTTLRGAVYNLSGALWDIQTNANIFSGGYGDDFFDNSGNVRKSAGAATASIYTTFINSGIVTNFSGVLSFNGGGVLAGEYGAASGATIGFSSGNFTMDVPPVISGAGLCEFTGATLALAQSVPTNLLLAGGSLILGPGFQNHGGITNLTLSGATIISTNSVTGTFTWETGTIAGPMTVAGGGVMNISGNVTLDNLLTNAGMVTMTSNGTLNVNNNNSSNLRGGVYNLSGALWDIQTNANIYNGGYGDEFFNNAGTFRKSGGTGIAAIYTPFANAGLVTNLIATLSFNGGGDVAGEYGAASNTTIDFASGSFTMNVPPSLTGSGLIDFTGTTLTLGQNVPPNLVLAGGNLILGPAFQNNGAITNLTLNGARLISTNTVTGMFIWQSGTLASPMTIASGGVLNISGNVTLDNLLTNAGTVVMTGNSGLSVNNNNTPNLNGGVYNLAGALWDIQTNANIFNGGYGDEFFINAGTFRKSGGTGIAAIYTPFTNSGAVSNQIGGVSFNGGGALAGKYDAAVATTIVFTSGGFTMGIPPALTGSGLCEFTGTTLTLNQTVPSNLALAGGSIILGSSFQNNGGITNLTLSGASLVNTNTVTGALVWEAGALAGPMTIASGGVLNISGNVTLDNLLTNSGTVLMTSNGNLNVNNNNTPTLHGGVYNAADALWDIQTNANIYNGGYGDEFFVNAGTFRKSGGSGTTAIYTPFANAGLVTNLIGTLSFNGGGGVAGEYGAASNTPLIWPPAVSR